MSIDVLKDRLPEYARDLKLNLSSLASEQLLSPQQKAGSFIAAALAANHAPTTQALVEAFGGDVFVSVRLAPDGRLARVHARDASWFQWPLLEAAIEGNIVADFPLCNKSFNCSYSGHDL